MVTKIREFTNCDTTPPSPALPSSPVNPHLKFISQLTTTASLLGETQFLDLLRKHGTVRTQILAQYA